MKIRNKKLIAYACALSLISGFVPANNIVNAESDSGILYGDISGNGAIDLYDAIEVAKYLVKKVTFTEEQLIIADYNQDGLVDLYDTIDVAKYLITSSEIIYPDFTGNLIASDDVSVTYSFELNNPAGTGFSRFDIHMYDENGEMSYYDEMTITDDNGYTAKTEYTFYQNGKFHLILFNGFETATSIADLTIDSIIGIGEIENDPEDVDPPEVTVEYDETVTGLALGNIFPIKITTNEPCYIRLDGMTSALGTEYETFVRCNGTYLVKASDEWGNTTDVEIAITAFEESTDDELSNDNPLTGSDRDSFWG